MKLLKFQRVRKGKSLYGDYELKLGLQLFRHSGTNGGRWVALPGRLNFTKAGELQRGPDGRISYSQLGDVGNENSLTISEAGRCS
jgi:hypothetical protein